MLRRLVRRFSGEWTGDGVVGSGSEGHHLDATTFCSAEKLVTELSLDLEDDDDDNETDRWIMDTGEKSVFEPRVTATSDVRRSGRRWVWVPDANAVWKVAPVKSESADGSSYTVISADGRGEIEVPAAKCADYDPSHSLDLADASRMNQMHEGPLLDLLSRRFQANTIYTNVADVLVSINPYADIPGLYDIPLPVTSTPTTPSSPLVRGASPGGRVAERTAALMRGFEVDSGKGTPRRPSSRPRGKSDRKKKDAEEERERETKARLAALKSMLGKPHVYTVADRAFKYMAETQGREVNGRIRKRNQSILITGESGSGKTEASKYIMRFLITASRALAGAGGVALSPGGVTSTPYRDAAASAGAAKHMENVLLRSTTVLEAFGNAKTVRNDNSSRFGKYIKLMYDEDFHLVGAKTEHFLLEKSRLVHLDNGERSYHILYQVAKALPRKVKEELGLDVDDVETFKLLNQGNCLDASDDVDDHKEFKIVDKALSSLKFSSGEKKDIWRLLAAVLHSGEVRFEDVLGTDHCRMAKSGRGEREGDLTLSHDELAALWGVDRAVFETALVQRTVKAGDASASIKLNAAQAKDNLLALLKNMYRQLFAWINWKINEAFDVAGGVQGEGENGVGRTFIGILDIFGFEIMATNSFEQLCINYANEVLQQEFNHHIFVLEQEEYGAEGLDVESIPFRDNQNIIDLIAMRPAGLMPILEDQALTGRQAASMKSSFTDKNLLDLFHQQHHRKAPHPCYRKPRFDGLEFVVLHFAGDVTYCASGFLEKNNDTLHEDLRELLLSSRIPFLQQLVLGGESGTFEQGAPKSRNGSLFPPSKIGRANQLLGRRNSRSDGSNNDTFSVESDRQLKRAASTKIAAKMTVSNAFRRQLDDLVTQLRDTEPHYIKCIKPNASKEPWGWSSSLVIEQLRYSGVLEVVRIRREAFPMRVSYKQFYRLFGKLVSYRDSKLPPAEEITTTQARKASLVICEKVFGKNGAGTSFQMGRTKIFLRNDGLKRLRGSLRQHYFDLATRVQSLWRGAMARMRFATQRDAAIKIQRIARGRITKQRYQETRLATTTVQAAVRMWIARRKYEQCQASAVSIQALWRGWRQRGWQTRNASATRAQAVARGFIARRRKKRAEAAIRLQANVAPIVRGFLVRRRCKRREKSIVALQASFRGMVARKMLALEEEKRAAAEAAKKEMAATRVAAVWRGKLQRLRVYEMGVSAAKIQSLVRGRAARTACKARMAKVVKVQGAARMLLAKRGFKRTRMSALRAQRAIRAFLRNRHLRNRSIQIFEAARCGEAPSVARCLNEWPELLFVRDRHDAARNQAGLPSYSTLLHAACEGGSTDVVALLEPFLADVMAVNRWGDTSVHAAAARCHYSTLKLLGRRANIDTAAALRSAANGHPAPDPEAFSVGMSKEAFSLTAGMVRGMRLSDVAFTYGRDASRQRKEITDDSSGVDMSALVVAMEGGSLPPVEGVLKKKRETGWWKKRWCSIRQFSPLPGEEGEGGPALLYYRTKSDKKPSKVIMLQHCMLKRSGDVNHAFELHSPVMTSSRNKEGRLYFQAGDEEDLQRWMIPLRVLVKFYDFQNDKRTSPMEFLDLETRHRLVRVQNRRGQTPLHFATAFKGGESSISWASGVTAAIQRVSTWLIENGADPNAYDDEGETPMHCAAASAQAAIVRELEKRSGDCHLSRRVDGKTAAELLLPTHDMKLGLRPYGFAPKRTVLSSADVTDTPLLNPPSKLVGFTYVSIFLEELSLPSSVKVARPTLTMSVFSPKGKPVETGQDVTSPVLAFTNYFWWAHTWHMRTPLETLGPGSMVIFELRDLQAAEKNTVLCWGALPLDYDLLDTKSERMLSFLPPTDPVKLTKTRRSSGCLSLAAGGSRGDSDAPQVADASLSGDVILTRVLR